MSIKILCGCGKRYKVDDRHAGRAFWCKACGRGLRVPAAPTPEPAAAVDFDALDFGGYAVAGDTDDESAAPTTLRAAGRGGTGADAPGMRPTFASLNWSDRVSSTRASNPGNMRIDPALCLRTHPSLLGTFGALTVAGVALGILVKPALFLLCGAALCFLVMELNGIAGRFRSGDVNPGVVVSTRPYLVATVTDLGNAGKAYPAVKVIRAALGGMAGGPPTVGTPVTTASYYAPGVFERGHWADFDPVVTETVTRNAADIARLKASIPAYQWRALAEVAPTLPSVFALYYLWEPDYLGKAIRQRRKNTRGLIYVAILAVATGLVIYSNRRDRDAEFDQSAAKPAVSPGPSGPRLSPPAPTAAPWPPPPRPWASTARRRPAERDRPAARTVGPSAGPAPQRQPSWPEPSREAGEAPDATGEAPSDESSDSDTAPSAPAVVYKAGQSVEVKWGSQWYPSTILKREGRKYLIHYDGWSDGSDEWVRTDRIRTR